MSVKILRAQKVDTGFPPIERWVLDYECNCCHRQNATLITLGTDQSKGALVSALKAALHRSPCPCSFEVT